MKQKRRVIIAHGWNDGEHNAWINWLTEELEKRHYEVIQPLFPHVHVPRLGEWVQTLRESAGRLDSETTLVGYSLGVPTILRFLNDYEFEVKIAGLVMVAGFGDGIGGKPAALFDPPLDFELIKARTAQRISIYSDNDPVIAPSRSQQLSLDLDAREVIIMGGGHLIGLPVFPGARAELPAVLDAVLSVYHKPVRRRWYGLAQAVRRWIRSIR